MISAILYQKSVDESLTPFPHVGTRNMTSYGKHFIEEFLEILKIKSAHCKRFSTQMMVALIQKP